MRKYASIHFLLILFLVFHQGFLGASEQTRKQWVTITQRSPQRTEMRKTRTIAYHPGRFFGENRTLSLPAALGGGTIEYHPGQLSRALHILKGALGVTCGDFRIEFDQGNDKVIKLVCDAFKEFDINGCIQGCDNSIFLSRYQPCEPLLKLAIIKFGEQINSINVSQQQQNNALALLTDSDASNQGGGDDFLFRDNAYQKKKFFYDTGQNAIIDGSLFILNSCSKSEWANSTRTEGLFESGCQAMTRLALCSIENFVATTLITQLNIPASDFKKKERVRTGVSALTYAMIAYFKDEYLPIRYRAATNQDSDDTIKTGLRVEVGRVAISGNAQCAVQSLHAKKCDATNQLPTCLKQRLATSIAASSDQSSAEEYNPFKDIAIEKASFL